MRSALEGLEPGVYITLRDQTSTSGAFSLNDTEIARAAKKLPMPDVAAKAGLPAVALVPYGRDKAKLSSEYLATLNGARQGKLILVTAINPTKAGEGKTTTSIGLADALNRIGQKTMLALREPSLGPCFGMKGGATGGGQAQICPREDINLHFTGDFHAITAAHNLLAAMIDNHLHFGSPSGLDPQRVRWRRVLDMNDRSLRETMIGLGGTANGPARESGFDITVASEIMAILCLAENAEDLEARLNRMVIGARRDGSPVYASDLRATGAMMALLRDAMLPNLVQTLENNPCLIHGGPFANIAHGCNSVIATRAGLALADYVVTEAGFGADLGAEKFLNIKCRQAGLAPSAAVLVATVRALKLHGGGEDEAALTRGLANLDRHLQNLSGFGLPVIVAINRFSSDTSAELEAIERACRVNHVPVALCTHWSDGGRGAEALARLVVEAASRPSALTLTYANEAPLFEKIEAVAKSIYRARAVEASPEVRKQLARWEKDGYGHLPVCMAKTQYSFSTDAKAVGAPEGHTLSVRDVRLSAGAGFVVAICGDVMTMPGLPKKPAAEGIFLSAEGFIEGLN